MVLVRVLFVLIIQLILSILILFLCQLGLLLELEFVTGYHELVKEKVPLDIVEIVVDVPELFVGLRQVQDYIQLVEVLFLVESVDEQVPVFDVFINYKH